MGYKIVFSELKSKVGITDVADALGYSLNKKAGVGRYVELNLGPAGNPVDTIIVKNSNSKAQQTFFRRNGSKGDVVTLIRENLNSFNVPGDNEWTRTANVLASFANLPYIENRIDRQRNEANSTEIRKFEPQRYHTLKINPENPHWILKKRGFSQDTLNDFKDKINLVKDNYLKNFDGYNIGFPYRNAVSDNLSGYEIRGGAGFKSKAAGTDSTNSFWYAEFRKSPDSPLTHIFLFESGFDAMAFYQVNKAKIENVPFSLVSFGGAFSESQIEGVQKKYPGAVLVDCFDNDLAGNVYSANLVRFASKLPVNIDYKGTGEHKEVLLSVGSKIISAPADNFSFEKEAEKAGIKYSVQHWKPPVGCKDWNDCLTELRYVSMQPVSKYERENNLANRRKSISM